jgi:hypothetical protein
MNTADLTAWTATTTARLVRNARFWIDAGMTVEDALAKVFAGSVAGPAIREAVRGALA